MIICPNFSNPDVAREFNELKEATSEKAAYAIWSLNNGNPIDRAPNGAPSKLFEDLLNYFKGDRVKAIQAKANTFGKPFMDWFGDWIGANAVYDEEGNRVDEVSKVVDDNGEPLIMYRGDKSNKTEFTPHYVPYNVAGIYIAGTSKFASNYAKKDDEEVYPIFVNSKNPFTEEYLKKENIYNMRSASDIWHKNGKLSEYDGWIYGNLLTNGEFVVDNPNQVKSINNDGTFTDGNNIYHNLKTDSPRTVNEIASLLEDILRDYYNFHRYYGLKETKSNRNRVINEDAVYNISTAFGFPAGTISLSENGTSVRINKQAIRDGIDIFRNKLNHSNVTYFRTASLLVQFMMAKFPQIKGIKLVESLEWNGRFKDGYVYLNFNASLDVAAEECLHPFIEAIFSENKELFGLLLKEVLSEFKLLRAEIAKTYSDKKGFNSQDRQKELVTQALARHFSEVFEEENQIGRKQSKSIWLKAWDWILEKLGITGVKDLNKNMTLRQLAEAVFKANNISINDTYFVDEKFNLSLQSQDALDISITRQMYDTGVQIETERSQFITQVLNRYKKDNPDASQQDLSKVINGARHTFDTDRCNDLLKQKQQFLAQQFGLIIDRDGYYKSGETTQKKVMLEHFINSLQNDTFKAYQLHNIGKGKYLLVGSVLNAHSVANVLYNALYEGDLTTLDKEIARDYVRMFWGSDLIQAALDVLNAPNKTSQQLEDELVNRMTSVPAEQRDTNIVQWFKNFWNSLNQLVKTVFGKHTFTDQQKDDILKAVDAAFMLAEDLDIVNEDKILLDRMDGDFDSSYLLSDTDKTAFSSIYQGIQTRIKSQQSRKERKTNLIADLKTSKEKIEARDSESIKDTYETIKEFLIAANKEIGEIRYYIDKTLIGVDMHQWNPYEINFIQQDLIGYYSNLLQVINDMFADPKSSVSVYNKILVDKEGVLDLKQLQLQLQRTINSLQKGYNNSIVLPYVRMVLTDYANENKDIIKDTDSFVYNMNRWLEQDQSCGDLAAGEVLVGMASRSKSPIVRIVEKMVSDAEFDTNREVLRKGHELVRLFNKIRPTGSLVSPYNWQKRFMEFDRDGIPTGYFIRDINYGQFYRDKDAKEEELRKKYELDVDEDGNTIFTDKDLTAKDSVYNKYYDELDKWLCDHCERRYTLEYYKAKRRFLSPKTLQAQNQIQRQIDLLLDKARLSSGLVDLSKLTVNERRQLDIYRREKRDLGSHYIFTEDNNSIVHVQEKSAEGLKMADEISAWNKYIADKVKYKPDWTAFNKAKQELIDSGASQEEIDAFERNNTTMRITPEFYDLLRKVVGKGASNPELEALKKRHSEILNALKNRQGAGSHELAKLGLGLNTDTSGWLELQRLEQRMADIRRDLKRRGIKGEPGEIDSLTFDQIAKMMPVVVGDEDSTHYLDYLIEKWREAAASNTNLTNVFNSMFMYTDEKGTLRYLNAFKYLSPTNFSINVNGTVIKCIETLPGSEYSELDESSPFVNENFIKDGPSMQAKKSMYKNEDFYNLTTDEKTFLDKMIETMSEANDMIPIKSLNRDYLLPQISGRTMTVMSNSIQAKEWSTALKYPLRKFGVTYAETDTDVSTNIDLARRPDGTVVNNIPIRFIEKLKNPLALTTDVLGSVIMYYDMATNYKNKSKNISTLELIKYAVNPDISTTEAKKLTSQYKKIENILDQRYYGKETSFGFDSNEKITPSKQSTIQATKTIRNIAAVAMLGVNFTTIEVGYLDAMCSMFADAVGGKYITTEDMRYAFAKCIAHTGKVLNGLGRPDVDDKLVAAMQYNQLSRSNSEIFSSLDKFKLDKFIHDHLLMGGYTLTDYMVNGMMLMATYHHYRLIENPETGKKQFYSKSDAINQFTKLGYTEKQAIKLWKKSRVTLWDAYDNVKGDFVLKDEYKDIVTKKLENRISGRLRDRTAMYNGIVPQTEKAKLQQNVFGSFVTLMRNFYINTYWDRFKTGADFVAKDDDHTITWKSEYQRDDLGLVNFETGEFEGAVFKDFARGMYKLTSNAKRVLTHKDLNKLTREQKYAVNRSVVELLQIGTLLFAMLWSIAFARANNYDDDKDPAWLLNLTGDNIGLHFKYDNMWEKFLDWARWKLALLSTRGFIERLTSWWAPTALEPINDPTVAMSYMDDVGSMWGLVIDLFSQRTGEEIKSGGYKHMTRGTRDILKLLSPIGVDNLVRSWHTDGIKSTLNYYRGLTPTNAIVPTQEEWNKAHGLGKHGAKRKDNKTKKTSENDVEYVY